METKKGTLNRDGGIIALIFAIVNAAYVMYWSGIEGLLQVSTMIHIGLELLIAIFLFMGNKTLTVLWFLLRAALRIASSVMSALSLEGAGALIYTLRFNAVPTVIDIVCFIIVVLLAKDNRKYKKIWYIVPMIMVCYAMYGTMPRVAPWHDAVFYFDLNNLLLACSAMLAPAWLAYPERNWFEKVVNMDASDSATKFVFEWIKEKFIQSVIIMTAVFVIIGFAVEMNANTVYGLRNTGSMMLICTFIIPIVQFFNQSRKAHKANKQLQHTINTALAADKGPMGSKARADLKAEAAKDAKNKVVKAAVVGQVLGGDLGAVTAAAAEAARQNAENAEKKE